MDEKQLEQLMSIGGSRTMADVKKLIRAYFYSDPKIGKTDLTAQICQELGLSPIWVTTDSGWTTILKYPDVADRVRFETFDSFKQIRLIVEAHNEGYEPYASHDSIVIDTASRAVDDMLREVVALHPLPKEQQHPSIEAWGHYRLVESSVKDTVKMLKDSDMHVFYLAHIRDPNDKDKEKKRFAIRPAGPEACYRVIAQEANLIGWLYKEKDERKVQFNPTLQETAGTQIPTIQEKTYPVNQIPQLLNKYINS